MQELIARVAAAAGLSEEVARRAVAQIFAFIEQEGPAGPVGDLMRRLPGASDLAATAPAGGGLMGALGGLMGGGGLMALAGRLTGLGLGMGEMQSVGRETLAYARERAGDERVRQVADAIPGLSQLI